MTYSPHIEQFKRAFNTNHYTTISNKIPDSWPPFMITNSLHTKLHLTYFGTTDLEACANPESGAYGIFTPPTELVYKLHGPDTKHHLVYISKIKKEYYAHITFMVREQAWWFVQWPTSHNNMINLYRLGRGNSNSPNPKI